MTDSVKQSSLLQYRKNYRFKKFYSKVPDRRMLKNNTTVNLKK
jgi:hypothetical protein